MQVGGSVSMVGFAAVESLHAIGCLAEVQFACGIGGARYLGKPAQGKSKVCGEAGNSITR